MESDDSLLGGGDLAEGRWRIVGEAAAKSEKNVCYQSRGRLQSRKILIARECLIVMVIRIASVVLSLAGLLALALGLLFWAGAALDLVSMHMLLGLLAVGTLLVIGIGQALSAGGSWTLAVCALVVGALMIVIGMNQASLMAGDLHWVIRVIHLLLGLLTIGLGHMGAARYRRGSAE
jgi:hypothetical protein